MKTPAFPSLLHMTRKIITFKHSKNNETQTNEIQKFALHQRQQINKLLINNPILGGWGCTHMLTFTGMFCGSGLVFHKKSLDRSPIFVIKYRSAIFEVKKPFEMGPNL